VNASRLTALALAAISATVTGARPSDVAHAAAMTLELTVGEFDGLNSCTGTEESLTAPVGTQVEYCYVMRNTGDHTLTMHDLDNDVFGLILGDVAIELEPGESIVSSHVEPLTGTHTSTATWTATNVQHDTEVSTSDSVTVTALPFDPSLDVAAESAAMSVAMTVMVDDGTDTCGTDVAAIVEKGTSLRFCYTMTNTGDEALNLHDVWDSHIGHIAGPGFDHLVQPGDGVSLTATGVFDKSGVHGLTWEATGVESDTVVNGFDGVSITVLGPEITLDMTVMVDDGHGTCGTESEIAVPAGTQVTYCYTMTDSGDEDVNYHFLDDDQLGSLINHLDREIAPGETLVHTEVAIITEAVTSTAQWAALSQGTGTDVSASDSVTVEIGDVVEPATTTTTTVPEPQPCAIPEPSGPPPTGPPPTSPPTTAPPTTEPPTTVVTTTTTTSTSTTTTTTQPPSFTTTTEGLGIVLPTTSTTVGEPAGFARRVPGAACPETPPGDGDGSDGGVLPATGSPAATQTVLALAIAVMGSLVLITARSRRP
jgi:hypothetical protein